MGSAVPMQVLQSAVVVLGGPLYTGAMARAEAIVASKRGPSVFQPYRDLAKLLRKGSATSDQASWVFRGAPVVDPTRPLLREHELTICEHFGIGEEVGRAAAVAGLADGAITSIPPRS